jgi:hypothetical protein
MLLRRKFLSMLPGFRFLVAAIVFSLSLLVFGLGAAALFRAAHEQFASSSSWRTTPEGSYTSFLPPAEPPRPVIAMLRVEPPVSAPAPTSEPHNDLPSIDTPVQTPAVSAEASDIAPAATATAPAELQEATVAAAPSAPAPEPTVVAAATPIATATSLGNTEAAKIETATIVPPLQPTPTPEVVVADPPKPDNTTTSPATPAAASSPPVTTDVAIARQDVLPAEAKVPATTAVVTSDAANATPVPAPAPSRGELLAQMLALSADRAAPTEHKASIRIASLHLHQSLARKRQAKERLAKQRLAEAQRAKRQRQMALRARAAREAAARQQQQQIADPFAQPQGFGPQAAFGQQQAQRTR